MLKRLASASIILLAACSDFEPQAAPQSGVNAGAPAAATNEFREASKPAQNEGAEPSPTADTAPATETGQGDEASKAKQVADAYFAAISDKRLGDAWNLRAKGTGDNAESRKAFFDHYSGYQEFHATVGNPGPVEGAAGSLYTEIPVQLYGRVSDGKPFGSAGIVTLRRTNDVPGSTVEQRSWRIYSSD